MIHRSVASVMALSTICAVLLVALGRTREDDQPDEPRRLLPGVQRDGYVLLPNQWRLRPAGSQLELGDFPVNMAIHPDGQFMAVLHAGYRDHEIMILDLRGNRPRPISRAVIDQAFYGLTFSPDGRRLYASGGEYEVVHEFGFRGGYLTHHSQIPVADAKSKFVVGGVAITPDGKTLLACGTFGNALAIIPLEAPESIVVVTMASATGGAPRGTSTFRENEAGDRASKDTSHDGFPYGVMVEPGGRRAFVSLWNKAAVAVVDLAERKIAAVWPTEAHPTEMSLRADGRALYVACANSTKVSVIDPDNGKALQTLHCALYPAAPSGNTPNSLSLTPDGQMLFVANADANNVAVFNVTDRDDAKPLGFIPVGWYPTCVRFNGATKSLHVSNGKGMMPRANPHGPQPRIGPASTPEYIAGLFRGTLTTVGVPAPEQMARYSRIAYACSPLRSDAGAVVAAPPGNPIPAKVGDPSPIKYVIYIIKENRTYDQIFGDMKQGNGAPELCLFPEPVTPNHHAIARDFVLLDNIFAEGEVSADGHEWSMGAYATDFVEKIWPLSYRSPNLKKLGYPSEGNYDSIERPAGGYIWDRCAEANVSYRSYGEWVANGKTPNDPRRAMTKAIEGHFDPEFHSYDLDYSDQKRADRFISELQRFERDGDMPRLQIVRLPNDHTFGTRNGKPTPTAMVADNDLALGRVIEAVSKSKHWKETAVFVIEDDAQNGPDHVDAHRVAALVVSPYCKRNHVDSSMYSTSSMLRTMGLILGTKPMSQFDAAARPMYAAFQPTPDLRPYEHRVPKVNMNDKNTVAAWGSQLSEKFDLAKEDQADDLLFNEVIWRSVRGANSPMPAPVRAAWFFPHKTDD